MPTYRLSNHAGLTITTTIDNKGAAITEYTSFTTLLLKTRTVTYVERDSDNTPGPDACTYVLYEDFGRHNAATTRHQRILADLFPHIYRMPAIREE